MKNILIRDFIARVSKTVAEAAVAYLTVCGTIYDVDWLGFFGIVSMSAVMSALLNIQNLTAAALEEDTDGEPEKEPDPYE